MLKLTKVFNTFNFSLLDILIYVNYARKQERQEILDLSSYSLQYCDFKKPNKQKFSLNPIHSIVLPKPLEFPEWAG